MSTYLSKSEQRLDVNTSLIVLDNYLDGILLISECGELLKANSIGIQICCQLQSYTSQQVTTPEILWQVCQSILGSCISDESEMFESEIETGAGQVFRIRGKTFNYEMLKQTCLLLVLENQYQINQQRAIVDAKQYGLTPREAQIWSLRLANHSLKEIASELFISINTVKKHIKNILAKRQKVLLMGQSSNFKQYVS